MAERRLALLGPVLVLAGPRLLQVRPGVFPDRVFWLRGLLGFGRGRNGGRHAPRVAVRLGPVADEQGQGLGLDVRVLVPGQRMQVSAALHGQGVEVFELDGSVDLGPQPRVLARPVLARLDGALESLGDGLPRVADGAQLGSLAEQGLQVLAHGVTPPAPRRDSNGVNRKGFGCGPRGVWGRRTNERSVSELDFAHASRLNPKTRFESCQLKVNKISVNSYNTLFHWCLRRTFFIRAGSAPVTPDAWESATASES